MKIIERIVDWWMRRCPHYGYYVAADILEGGGSGVEVKYCRRCGAVRTSYSKEWRRPRPLWY